MYEIEFTAFQRGIYFVMIRLSVACKICKYEHRITGKTKEEKQRERLRRILEANMKSSKQGGASLICTCAKGNLLNQFTVYNMSSSSLNLKLLITTIVNVTISVISDLRF